jgi:subtilisin-like proprotein convertase family protein/V8-like Glu-specific endopeptidase
MKILNFPTIAILFLGGSLVSSADPKTTYPVRIDSSDLGQEPFRFNGVIRTSTARGSGFCAWHNRTFFSAAHVVYGEAGWEVPPLWYPEYHSFKIRRNAAIQSRGYFRWTSYADLAGDEFTNVDDFSQDVVMGYAFKDLIDGTPAPLNRNGEADLRQKNETMITGYPAENAYYGEDIEGYYLHQTGPKQTIFKHFYGDAVTTTLLTTGPGNSGGPVWVKDAKSNWRASGVLVGGRPSECVVYGFSNSIRSLTRAVAPVIQTEIGVPLVVPGVSATSLIYPYDTPTRIPDGVHKWTSFPFAVDGFADGDLATVVKLSLRILTTHRGDLVIVLQAPGGASTIVHNEEGAGGLNLTLNEKDYSAELADSEANGTWFLRVQDRLKGDSTLLKSIRLEISTESAQATP